MDRFPAIRVNIDPVLAIPLGMVNSYVIPARDGCVLVDTGSPGSEARLLAGLVHHGIRPEEIRLVVITHVHSDHVGGLWAIRERCNAPVMAHRTEAPLLEGAKLVFPAGTGSLGRAIARVAPLMGQRARFRPCKVDRPVAQETSLVDYGLDGRVLLTPGHTAGSLTVLLQNGEACVGDLCFNVLPFGWGPILPPFGEDIAAIRSSWRRLLDSGATTILPSHGKPFSAAILRLKLTQG